MGRVPDTNHFKVLSSLQEWTDNYNRGDVEAIARSIRRFGMNNAPRVWRENIVMAGNHTTKALKLIREQGPNPDLDRSWPPENVIVEGEDWYCRYINVAHLEYLEAKAYAIADNHLARQAVTDDRLLAQYLQEIVTESVTAFRATGFDQQSLDALLMAIAGEEGAVESVSHTSLAESFIIPPFSVFDTRQGYWLTRKKAWLGLGINSELGRGTQDRTERGLTYSASAQGPNIYELRNKMRSTLGRDPSWDEIIHQAQAMGYYVTPGTSIFDPVLCELAYRWFCIPGGDILDPFAGGSVRGVVAAALGYHYTGIDLREEQVQANQMQAETMGLNPLPTWLTGDSTRLDQLIAPDVGYDFVFSCPPYFDLERYSDDANDLSNAKSYAQFISGYRAVIAQACARLRPDRFACFVVGDVRDRKGFYRNFVSDTITAFQDAGLHLYNEAILVNQAASLAVRVRGMFSKAGKLGKQHQNVLIFMKGDPKQFIAARGEVQVHFPDEDEEAEATA